ncbi:MAG: hypothetical protein OXQ84_07750 [bacterium]|nr:hypothetical protein [bacterium]
MESAGHLCYIHDETRHGEETMEDITNWVVETDFLASETAVLHVGLPATAGRDLERVCRRGMPVEVTSRGAAPAEVARDAAALVADFAVLARKGTMSTAIPSGAFVDRRQIAVMTGLEQPVIYDALMSGKLPCEDIDGHRMVRYDDLVAFMETPRGTRGQPLRQTGVAYVLATGEGNRHAVKAADLLEPICESGEPVEFRNRYDTTVRLETETFGILANFLHRLAMARMVTVLPKHARLTPDQAASAIRKQPSYIGKVLASGELRSIEADDGHIVRYSDLMAFHEALRRWTREGMERIQYLGQLELIDETEEPYSHAVADRRGTSLYRAP